MGEVHVALLETVGGVRKLVAIKLALRDEPELHAGLLTEARLGALVVHPNVAQILDAGVEDSRPWFAMEYVAGVSLAKLFAIDGECRVPPWTWARILADACGAVHAVHEARDENGKPLNIVHRDITPQNLLLGWNGVLKLVDLGIARSALHQRTTSAGILKGKLGYMSPEQGSGERVDRRSDIFSLGVLLWEALAGKKLFARANEAETLASIIRCDVPPLVGVAPDLPPALMPIVARSLSREPSSRYGSALEMQQALEFALCENRIVIGSHEVAQVLTTLGLKADAPERIAGNPSLASTRHMASGSSSGRLATQRARRRAILGAGAAMTTGALVASVALSGTGSASRAPDPPQQSPIAGRAKNPDTAPSIEASLIAPALATTAAVSLPGATPKLDTSGTRPSRAPSRKPQSAEPSKAVGHDLDPSSPPTLNISSRPIWASIHVDGKLRGTTPLVVNDLAPGAHVVEGFPLGKPPSQRKTVVLRAGVVERLDFQLEPTE